MKSLLLRIKQFFWPESRDIRLRRLELIFWAFILSVAYSPLPFGFLAWVALIRPLIIISGLDRKQAFRSGYFYAWFCNLFTLYWVAVVTPAGMVAAIFILSLYPAIILATFAQLYQKKKSWGLILMPFLWVGMEYFRSLTEIAFPWTDLAYTQGYYLRFIQIVSVIGCYGLSFIIVLFNIFIWQVLSKENRMERRVSYAIALIALLAAVFFYGYVVYPPYPEKGPFDVALLQGNVDLKTKWGANTRDRNFILYDSLAQEAAKDSVDLIIWPETAAPTYLRTESIYNYLVKKTARKSGVPNLVGALDMENREGKEKAYNSAFQVMPDGTLDKTIHHKIKLVPFSERSPYQEYLPFLTKEFLSNYWDAIKKHEVQWWSDFYEGDSIVVFKANGEKYAVLICFEVTFPDFVRQCVLKGASFLVNITNDTWFGRSIGPYQHMRIAVFRAVENRIWIARCANSGISAVIDPYGREMVSAGLYKQAIISYGLQPLEEMSQFTRIGPVVGVVSYWVMLMVLIIRFFFWMRDVIRRNALNSFWPTNWTRKRY